MFKASRRTCYEDVLPLPTLEDVADRVRKGRVLLIVSPDSKIPPEEVQKFFDGLTQKNNLCVLTGDKTAMGSVEKAARQHFAAQKADGRIAKGHPQRDDLERKQQSYEQDFNSTILNLFDKVLFPIQRAGKTPQLAAKALDMTRDAAKPFNGEEQIEKTLTSNPLKLYLLLNPSPMMRELFGCGLTPRMPDRHLGFIMRKMRRSPTPVRSSKIRLTVPQHCGSTSW
jgi:hypothetical protein